MLPGEPRTPDQDPGGVCLGVPGDPYSSTEITQFHTTHAAAAKWQHAPPASELCLGPHTGTQEGPPYVSPQLTTAVAFIFL